MNKEDNSQFWEDIYLQNDTNECTIRKTYIIYFEYKILKMFYIIYKIFY